LAGYEVRAVTFHAGTLSASGQELESSLEELAERALEAVDSASSATGLRPTYVRVALPGVRLEDALRVAKVAERLGSDLLLNAGAWPASADLEKLVDVPRSGAYLSILLAERTWEEARRASAFIHSLSSSDPALATRVAINVTGEAHLITPYYPLASAVPGRDIVTAALTYPSYLAEAYSREGLQGLRKAIVEAGSRAWAVVEEVSRLTGFEAGGVDLSVSPWMEDSSLGLAELVSGVRMPRPGFALGVRAINEAISAASGKIKTVGFNELMLPLAEDSKLKARASEGDVTARYLAMLSGVCVAGLDMVPVPASVNDVAGLFLDVAAYALAKGRALGVRLIPVEGAEPGDRVDLGRFGDAPVIPI
jgi:uncharacterized protein (UPF0210 family)